MSKQTNNLTAGVVGLGLIGGSMAKAIREKTGARLLACDKNSAVMEAARSDGVLCGELDGRTIGECDLLLLALYPKASVAYLKEHAAKIKKGAVVTDLCGVKRSVEGEAKKIAAEHGFTYIGGHPMAGTEHSGYRFSKGDLFEGASMILTPAPDIPEETSKRLADFFLSLGFREIRRSTPQEHDRVIAYTSQLAHVLSSAYIKSPSALTHRGFSAGSFRDMTRVAWLNEEMWTELFLENGDYLAAEVEGLAERLLEYAAAIRGGEEEKLRALLREGRVRKEQVEGGMKG